MGRLTSIQDADVYIKTQIIDIEDWEEAEESKKQRILNAASRTLKSKFTDLEIPNEAIYHFAAWLSIVFNDTNRYQLHGIAGFSITGVSSFTFKKSSVSSNGRSLASMIPDEVYDLIGEENGIDLSRRRIGRSVR